MGKIFKNWPVLSGLLLALAAAWIIMTALLGRSASQDKTTAPRQGFLAPDFLLETGDGGKIQLSALRGRAVIVNLWATWCPPCQAEMPALQKIYQEYNPQGLEVLAVNTTFQDQEVQVLGFAAERGLTFPILLDRDSTVARDYNLKGLPSTFFIDREGVIQNVVVGGPMSEGFLRSVVMELLGENP